MVERGMKGFCGRASQTEKDLRRLAKIWVIHSPPDRKIKRTLREAAQHVHDIKFYSNVCKRASRR